MRDKKLTPVFCRREPPRVIAAQVRRVDNLILRRINGTMRESGVEEVTAMHGWILHYLADNEGREIYQRDIEQAFSITRSTVTNIVKLMEKKGYIRRESVPEDARLKKLVLTEKGARANASIRDAFLRTDDYLSTLLSPDECETLLTLLDKLKAGMHENRDVRKP